MQNIPNSDLYFFNNMYDDKTVFDEMIKDRKMNFFQAIRHQDCIQGFKRVGGKVSDFVVDRLVNQTLGIPMDSYTYHLDYSIVPYYTKKRFLDKYDYNQPISLNTIFSDHEIFNHMVLCQVQEYFFFGLEMAEAIDGCYLIIRLKKEEGVTKTYIDTLIENNARWTVFFQNQVEVLTTFKNKYLLIQKNGNYYINVSHFEKLSTLKAPRESEGEWNLFISCSTLNTNLTMGCRCTYVKGSIPNTDCIIIPYHFAEYVMEHSTKCKCYLMNARCRTGNAILLLRNSMGVGALYDENKFAYAIPYNKVPVSPRNVYVYEWDDQNALKKKLLDVSCEICHPNQYIFTLNLEKDEEIPEHVYIEWYEAPETQCRFDNIMQDLVDYCSGNDGRTSTFYNALKTGTLSPEVCEYRPTELTNYDFKEFMTFDEYPDIRAFRMALFIEMLQENPARYKSLIRKLYSKMRESITHVYYESKNPEVFSRNVMDTSGEIPDSDYAFYFDEPMMYFKVHLSKDITPSATVYVNGYRVNTEYIHTVDKEAFIYIKRSNLDTAKENVVDIEVFLYDTTPNHRAQDTVRFFSVGVSTIIKNNRIFDQYLPISHYSFIDKRTNEPLRPGEITFRYSLDERRMKAMSGEPIEFYFKHDDREFFLTNNGEYFIDEDYNFLNVRHEAVIEDIPNDSHKILNNEFLFMVLNTSYRINDDIIITNNNNYRKEYQPDGMKGTSLTMVKFRDKLDPNRFRVYYSGRLLNSDEYILSLPHLYNEDVNVNILNVSAQHARRDIIFEYLPVDEDVIYEGNGSIDVYHDNLFWFDNLSFPLIPEMMRVFINGIKVPQDRIIDVNAINVFSFPDYKMGDHIKILIPAIDEFKYGMDESEKVINAEMRVNDGFTEYLVSKAKK